MTSEELRDALEDVVTQFAYEGERDGMPAYSTGGLSALEHAFAVLGWSDPHPVPGMACDEPGCNAWASCGKPTPDGYRRVCSVHYQALCGQRNADRPTPKEGKWTSLRHF